MRAALAWIPNADLDYDSWVRIGMAIKGGIGEAGAELFAAWSAQSAKDDAAVHRQDLGGLQAQAYRRRHALSPRHRARLEARCGAGARWRGAARCRASGGRVVGEGAERPGRADAGAASACAAAAPALDRLDGVLGAHGRHILATAIRPQPWLAVGAALAVLGALMGRKVRTPTNLRSNLYVLGIAESGGGKDHARKAIKEILVQRRPRRIISAASGSPPAQA